MSWKPLFAVGVALACATRSLPADDPESPPETYELRHRFTEQQELHYRIDDERRIEVHDAQVQDTVRYTTQTWRRHVVKDVAADGAATIEITILRALMTAESGEDRIEFDSAVNAVPPQEFRAVLETIGRPLGQVSISPLGAVSGTQLLISTQDAVEFESAQRDLLPTLPESPVAVGDTWRDPFEVDIAVALDQPLKKRIRLERVYSLEAVENGVATIAVRTVVLSPVRDGFQEGQLIYRTTHGTIQFDIERGLLVDRSMTLDNRVVGFQGPQTSLSVESSRQDFLIPETDLAAQQQNSAE